MNSSLLSFVLAAVTALPVLASAQDAEGRRLAELVFESLDTADRDFVDFGEFSTFGGDVFVSMDTDGSGKLSLAEFLSWDFGMLTVAQDAGREEAYETSLRVVFAFWDRNGDGEISRTEHRQSMAADFQRADLNNDAVLSKEEFLGGYTVNVAARAAINPAPVE